MEKEFVNYNQAVALKELGFSEICLAHYWENLFYYKTTFYQPATMPNSPESCLAPLKQQVFRWFREKYELFSFVFIFDGRFGYETYKEGVSQINDSFDTYEEAENACIDKLIELVKQQDK
jgi:hypothetical protein